VSAPAARRHCCFFTFICKEAYYADFHAIEITPRRLPFSPTLIFAAAIFASAQRRLPPSFHLLRRQSAFALADYAASRHCRDTAQY